MADIARVVGVNRDHAVVEDFRIGPDDEGVPSILARLDQLRLPADGPVILVASWLEHGVAEARAELNELPLSAEVWNE